MRSRPRWTRIEPDVANTAAWRRAGGALVMAGLDARVTVAYVMNQMLDQGSLGDDRAMEIVLAASGVI